MDTADKWEEILISIGIPSTTEIKISPNKFSYHSVYQLKILRYGKRSLGTRDIKSDPDNKSNECSQIYKSTSAVNDALSYNTGIKEPFYST